MNWVYYKNNRSIVAAILFHMALDATAEAFQTEHLPVHLDGVLLFISILVIAGNRAFFFEEKGASCKGLQVVDRRLMI